MPPAPSQQPPGNGGGVGGGIGNQPPIVVVPGWGWHWGGGAWNGADGSDVSVSVSGNIGDDHWRVHAHLNSPVVDRARRWFWWRYPYWGYSHWCWWGDEWRYPIGLGWDYTDSFLEVQSQQEIDRQHREQQDWERREAERFERLSDLEKGNELLATGRSADATTYYLKHLETAKDDSAAMRSLALALLDTDKHEQACAVMALAYEKTPALAAQPIKPATIDGGVMDYRKLITETVTFAHKYKGSSAWLTAAVLTQGEGRLDAARNMLSKARDAGLKGETLRQLEQAMGLKPLAGAATK